MLSVPLPVCAPIKHVALGGGANTQKKKANISTMVKAVASIHIVIDKEDWEKAGATIDKD